MFADQFAIDGLARGGLDPCQNGARFIYRGFLGESDRVRSLQINYLLAQLPPRGRVRG